MEYINSIVEKGTYVSLIADYPVTNYTKIWIQDYRAKIRWHVYRVLIIKPLGQIEIIENHVFILFHSMILRLDCPSGFIDLTMHQNQ